MFIFHYLKKKRHWTFVLNFVSASHSVAVTNYVALAIPGCVDTYVKGMN